MSDRTLRFCVLGLGLLWGSAQAAFSTDVSITGSAGFDAGYAATKVYGGGTQSGDFHFTEGGVLTSSTFSGASVTGANPRAGSLTDIGDGFGFTAIASATDTSGQGAGAGFGVGIDFATSVSNISLTDTYEVVFQIDLGNRVNADGPAGSPVQSSSAFNDAYSDSEISVSVDLAEVFFSDIVSDTFFGDKNPPPTPIPGSFGFIQISDLLDTLTLTLLPGASASLDMFITAVGEDFAGGLAELTASGEITVLQVNNITERQPPGPALPQPPSLVLLLGGLLLVRRWGWI